MLGAVALVGCLDTTAPPGSDPTTETFAPSLGVDISSMQKTTTGVYYKDLTVGSGAAFVPPTVTLNTVVAFSYTGSLSNGTAFDTGTVVLSDNLPVFNLLGGFVDGIVGMNVGGERLVVIPSDNGYGNQRKDAPLAPIPANSTLIFKVKLNGFQ